MPKGQVGETVGGTRPHEGTEGGGNPGGPLLLLSYASLQDTLPEGWSRSGLGRNGSGRPAQKRHMRLSPSGGRLRCVQVESQRAAQQAGTWEQVQEGGAGDQVTPG